MRKKAFTFLEMVLVLSIFMLLVGATIPLVLNSFTRNELEVAGQELVHVLRKANALAADQIQNSDWGLRLNIAQGGYFFFAGSNYPGRNPDFDITYMLPESVSFGAVSLTGGVTDLVFNSPDGSTAQDGSIELLGSDGETRTITISSFGSVNSD